MHRFGFPLQTLPDILKGALSMQFEHSSGMRECCRGLGIHARADLEIQLKLQGGHSEKLIEMQAAVSSSLTQEKQAGEDSRCCSLQLIACSDVNGGAKATGKVLKVAWRH